MIYQHIYSHIGNSQIHTLAEEQNRAHHQLTSCGACRAVIYTGTVCPHCRSDAAPIKEETGFKRRDCLSEPKDIVAKSDLEDGDDLSTAVMSMILVRPICCTSERPFMNSASTRTRMKTLKTQMIWIWRELNCRILRLEFCCRHRVIHDIIWNRLWITELLKSRNCNPLKRVHVALKETCPQKEKLDIQTKVSSTLPQLFQIGEKHLEM